MLTVLVELEDSEWEYGGGFKHVLVWH